MQVTPSGYTIAQYCDLMDQKTVRINRDYQRSPQAWPPAARSYLIDTVLLGYPMPKISLYQKTDLRSRKTHYEIVDGQQRSQAILDFFHDALRLTGSSEFAGNTYSQLDPEHQAKFISYQLTVDIFVGATDDDIRQMFRRINSYTVPLNDAEKRHATFQGEFKWFIVDLTNRYSQPLKDMGVLTEKQIARMADAALFTEVSRAMVHGLETSATAKLKAIYAEYDDEFATRPSLDERLNAAMAFLLQTPEVHNTSLMKPFMFYSLLIGVSHVLEPIAALQAQRPVEIAGVPNRVRATTHLTTLAAALDEPDAYPTIKPFVDASSQATNTLNNRRTRLDWICRALQADDLA